MENIQKPSCPANGCGCVGYAFVPIQFLNNTFSPMEALENGTLFPELKLDICEYGKICKQIGGVM